MNASVLSNYKKREVRVFISSTFRDMMDEREILVKKIFPDLRSKFRDRGITITEVDLRWGVLEEEAQNGKVIEICLSEIDRSRPYFIGILGERYGWIPEVSEYQKHKKIIENFPWVEEDIKNGLSITEMEVQYGVLRNPEMIKRSAFFIRESNSKNNDEIENSNKQNKLKERVKNTEGLFYSDYSNTEDLAEKITEHLTEVINRDFPEEEIDFGVQPQLNFINSRKLAYVRNNDYYLAIDEHFKTSQTPLVITGDRGIGKSSLLANYISEYAENNPDHLYLINFSDASVDSSDYIKVLHRFCEELSGREIDLGSEFPQDTFNSILSYFVQLLDKTSPTPLLIAIDGIDEFVDDEHSRLINWLPDSFPENVKVILSCDESQQLERVKEKKYRVFNLSRATTKFKTDFIQSYFDYFSKKLPQDIINEIVQDEISDLPLTLQSMADELRQYGVHEGLKERVRYYLKADGPVDYYDHVLARLEEDFNTKEDLLVKNILSVMSLFKGGVKELEIQQILNLTPLAFSSVFNAIENNLINKDGHYTFGNQYFRKAVEERYLTNEKEIKQIRQNIIDYIKTIQWDSRVVAEAVNQVIELKDYESLYELLSNLNHLMYLQDIDRYKLMKYWMLIKHKYKITEAYTFEKIEEQAKEITTDENFIITAMNMIAKLLYDLGMFVEVEPYLKRIYEISLEKLGDSATYTYANLKRLINIELILNKNEEAFEYVIDLLKIAEKYYEVSDSLYTQALYLVAKVRLARKEYEEAVTAIHYAIQGIMQYYEVEENNNDRLSTFHLDVLETAAKCSFYIGQKEEAYERFKEVLEWKIELYGEVSSEMSVAYNEMAKMCLEDKNDSEAIEYYKKSLEIRAGIFGKSHPLTKEIMEELKRVRTLRQTLK